MTAAPETEAPSVSSSSAGTSEVASRTKSWRSRAHGPGTARYGVRRGEVAVLDGHEIRVKTSPKVSSSDSSTAARRSQDSSLAEALRNVGFRNDQPQNKTTMPRDLGCRAPDCDSPVPEPITPWYSVDIGTFVNASGSCLHNLLHAQQPGAGWAGTGVQEIIPNGSGVCHASGLPGLEFILPQTTESTLIPTEAFTAWCIGSSPI